MSDCNFAIEFPNAWKEYISDNDKVITFTADSHADYTVRPLTGKDLERNLAERAKLKQYLDLHDGKYPEVQELNIDSDDGLSDFTVRPLTGKDLERNLSEREKMRRYLAMREEQLRKNPAE